jgi:ribonuclease BN (tRNA processing enzyme)
MAAGYDTDGGEWLASPPVDIEVLGSSGASSPERRSTSFLVGEELAIDAGCLASALTLPRARRVRTVLLTHRHLDHLKELPLFLDNVGTERWDRRPRRGGGREAPVEIGAERGTLAALFRHVMNGELWPDVRRFKTPIARFFTVAPGRRFTRMGLSITPIRVSHTVPSLGYIFRRGRAAAAVLGDTGYRPEVFRLLAGIEGLQFLLIEASYPSRLDDLARLSRHLTPALLERGLSVIHAAHPRIRVLVNHLKPPWAEEVARELEGIVPRVTVARDGGRYRLLAGR